MTNNKIDNNKRIAKNTLMLYIRQILVMLVSLYTVRITLNILGVEDYGLYNVIGGVVTMFSFLSSTMASASQRFFAYELGRNNYEQLKNTFSITMIIYILLGIIIILIAETVGLWFINNKMTIPIDRLNAAHWVFQFSLLSFMMTMFSVPYKACIIAHEKMNIYAYSSIIEVTLKLISVYLLAAFPLDKLKLYGLLIFIATVFSTLIYIIYSIRNFKESRFRYYWNIKLFKKIISYSGWNLFGSIAKMANNEGINILLNIFFNPVVNAARAIAYQVNGALNQFVASFMTAVNPQIIKYYAQREKEKMFTLAFQSAKYSYFLLLAISMPIILETPYILKLWLKNVPDYAVLFTRLVIFSAIINAISYSLDTTAQATGDIKKFQIIIGVLEILNLPVSYIFLKAGYSPEITMILKVIFTLICLFLKLYILRGLINFPAIGFIKKVLLRIIIITTITYSTMLYIFSFGSENFMHFIVVWVSGILLTLVFVYLLGLSKAEKEYIVPIVLNKINCRFIKIKK